MGICFENNDKKKNQNKSCTKNDSLTYNILGMPVVDLRSSKEKNIERNSNKPLQKPLESYAQEILAVFGKGLSYNIMEPKLREIGEKMNDFDKQLQVAYRAKFLCLEALHNGNKNCGQFSMRFLEYAWDGIGGWMK